MKGHKKRMVGIIHIGTVNMTLKIISYTSLDAMETIESVSQEIRYGSDVFISHHVTFASLQEICRILSGFKQLLRDYAVTDVRVISTTAIRKADNLLNVLDQIYIRTGFSVEVIPMTKEIYYKFFGLYYRISTGNFTFSEYPAVLLDITSGGVGLTCWQDRDLLFQQNVPIGSLQLLSHFTERQRNESEFPEVIREYIYGTLSSLWPRVRCYKSTYIILSGRAAMLIARMLGYTDTKRSIRITPQELRDFVGAFHGVTSFKLQKRYGLSEHLANIIMSTLVLYDELLRYISIAHIVIMDTTFTAGYSLYYVAEATKHPYLQQQQRLLLTLTRHIADKYVPDPAHSQRVERFCRQIFDTVYAKNGMTERHGYILQMAAVLHEIGKFINIRKHPQCTRQLVRHTDMFGLSEAEQEILSYVVYYGVGTGKKELPAIPSLPPVQQIAADKLIAVFRLADALDKSHLGKILTLQVVPKGKKLQFHYTAEEDIPLERWAFKQAAVRFAETFGVSPYLQKG